MRLNSIVRVTSSLARLVWCHIEGKDTVDSTYVTLYNLISTSTQGAYHRSCLIALPNDIMVYIKSWTEYQAQTEKLYEQQPDRVSGPLHVRFQGVIINKVECRRDTA